MRVNRLAGCVAAAFLSGCASRAVAPPSRDASPAAAPAHFATLDGFRVRYKSFGRGKEALVFIHGWTCDLESWAAQVPAFASRTHMVVLDLPGHGGSDNPPVRYTMDLFARAVEAVLRDAGVERAVLVGHSMGTPVARQFYRLYPRKTLALVAADGALKPYITDPSAVEKFIAPYRSASYRDVQSRMLGSTFSATTPPDARERISAVMLSTPQGVVVGAMEAMFDPAIWKDDPIGAPLLCVLAKNPYWNDEYEAYVRRLAPRLEYRVMEGTGHFLMVDKPAEFNAILSNFLTQNGLLGY